MQITRTVEESHCERAPHGPGFPDVQGNDPDTHDIMPQTSGLQSFLQLQVSRRHVSKAPILKVQHHSLAIGEAMTGTRTQRSTPDPSSTQIRPCCQVGRCCTLLTDTVIFFTWHKPCTEMRDTSPMLPDVGAG